MINPVRGGQVPAAVFSEEPALDQIRLLARRIFIAVGILFSSLAVLSVMISIPIPSPFMVLLGGISFMALGILIQKPQEQVPLPQNTEATTQTENPEVEQEEQEEEEEPPENDGRCCKRQELHRLLDNPKQVPEAIAAHMDATARQLKTLDQLPRTVGRPLLKYSEMTHAAKMLGYEYACGLLCPQFVSSYALLSASERIPFTYENVDYKTAYIAAFTGYGGQDDVTPSYLTRWLLEYVMCSVQTHGPLQYGYYNALTTLFAHLDSDLDLLYAPPLKNLLVLLFARNHLWIGNIGDNRAILFQQDSYTQLSCCTDPLPDQEQRPLPEPAITRHSILEIDGHLLIASPALWETVAPKALYDYIKTKRLINLKIMLNAILFDVRQKGCKTPVSAALIRILPQGNRYKDGCDAHSDFGSTTSSGPNSARRPAIQVQEGHFGTEKKDKS